MGESSILHSSEGMKTSNRWKGKSCDYLEPYTPIKVYRIIPFYFEKEKVKKNKHLLLPRSVIVIK